MIDLFRRLNLAAFQCKRLHIVTHVKLSPGLAERIVTGSHGHMEGGVPHYALYGTVYTVNKIPHVVRADLSRAGETYHVEFSYEAAKWPKPPKSVKSAQKLATLLAEEAQDVVLDSIAYFVYEEDNGWRSNIEVPIRLETQREGKQSFTHIESITLSSREHDHVEYSLGIGRTRTGAIEHRVYLT